MKSRSPAVSSGSLFAPARSGVRALWPGDLSRRLSRLNHVLVPDTKPERDALRRKLWVRAFGLAFRVFRGLSREGRALLLVLIPVSLASLDIRYGQVYLLLAVLFGLLGSSLFVRPLFSIAGARVGARCARRVSIGEPLSFEVQLSNPTPHPMYNLRLSLPFLPWDGQWKQRPPGIAQVLPGQTITVRARAVFGARGEHHLDSFEAAALVPGGLCIGPKVRGEGSRFLAVPRVAAVTQVSWNTEPHGAQQALAASHASEDELAFLRPYRVGDALKHLHVRTWARTGVPHVRQYVAAGQRRCTLSVFTAGLHASERLQEATLSLAAGVAARLALHQGGLDTLECDGSRYRIDPGVGEAALDLVLDRLAVMEAPPPSAFDRDSWQTPARGCGSWVLVSAGGHRRLSELVGHARAGGIACIWACVEDGDTPCSDLHPGAQVIDLEAIEQGRAVKL